MGNAAAVSIISILRYQAVFILSLCENLRVLHAGFEVVYMLTL